jgi:hypothetical protein
MSLTINSAQGPQDLPPSHLDTCPEWAVAQFNEMVVPREVGGETNPKFVSREKAASAAQMSQLLSVTEDELAKFMLALDTLDFAHAEESSILLSPKLPYIALEALRRGRLDPHVGQLQVATVLEFWAALQYHKNRADLQTISIFDSGAGTIIQETLFHGTDGDMPPFLGDGNKLAEFVRIMRTLPPSEQRFLLVPDIQGDKSPPVVSEKHGGNYFEAYISQAITYTGVNVFNRLKMNGQEMRIVSSVGMKQAFLEAQYGPDAVRLKPCIYRSTLSHIRESRILDYCDLMVPTPDGEGGSRCPATADGYKAPWYDFTEHDFYHAILTSAVGRTYRKVGIILADTVRNLATRAPKEDQRGLKQISGSLIDMEYSRFHHYSLSTSLLSVNAFWLTLNDQFTFLQTKVATRQFLEQAGFDCPLRANPISPEMELQVFKMVYQGFVEQKKGAVHIDEKSLFDAVALYKNALMDNGNDGSITQEEYEEGFNSPIVRFVEQLVSLIAPDRR